MTNGIFNVPVPSNEPVLSYGPGSPEKKALKAKIAELKSKEIEIPIIVGGEELKTGRLAECRCPHETKHLLGVYHKSSEKEVNQAIDAALKARPKWASMSWEARAAIFLKAAELLAGPYRPILNAATMLCQSKTVFQAEIDSACELIDFYRFNPYYMQQIYQQQPQSSKACWNYVEYRPLEGFVFAVTPFNFTSIAGNLPTAPAMMGNVVIWKPASSTVYTAYFIMQLLKEAGLPDGVINMVPGPGGSVGNPVMASPHLAGVHFTGSTSVFQDMWKTIGNNIAKYRTYPRIVGETGGKDFIFAHRSADLDALTTAMVRGAFEYQGQKCSAASRAYIPSSIWPELKQKLIAAVKRIRMGSPEDFTNFMGAVIDRAAYESIISYIDYAKKSSEAEFITGGNYSDAIGYFIEPTIVVTNNPKFKLMEEEIFGPVITLYIYPDEKYEETLHLCDETSPYGLTGSIIARDRYAIIQAAEILTHAAGNFYINDKPTGAVVGQQPFGGSRASGTNDKAGSIINLQRWVTPRAIKENFLPPTDFPYPHMQEP
ncbi:MAG: L-glutamate gamma-semialdehyde dehydrogenase [candidate division KSB1 bacterium]|nr:L-glutamate gamma-semialdehyde dehydrogenase [candidate division KSB1 bacterium]MDZ7335236.1 L-glutamate gamma-semialdehyde dehydrogenase [candidate division KSB1 bacterium]MDZ7401409.1 L-glutamate gamma-semialdehyde dehydrogenase [candidate division KSB1 bacterium]